MTRKRDSIGRRLQNRNQKQIEILILDQRHFSYTEITIAFKILFLYSIVLHINIPNLSNRPLK